MTTATLLSPTTRLPPAPQNQPVPHTSTLLTPCPTAHTGRPRGMTAEARARTTAHFAHSLSTSKTKIALVVSNRKLNYYYYHYTSLTSSFPGQPGQAGTRNVKPIWIYMRQRDGGVSGWQWQQVDHMQTICILLQAGNHTISQLLQAGCTEGTT